MKLFKACFVLSFCALVSMCLKAQIPGCSGVTPPTIAVTNGVLTKNTQAFSMRGLQIRGFVAPLQVSQDNASYSMTHKKQGDPTWQQDASAQQAYGDAELNAAATWNANLIRIQVSQPSLDPQDTEKDLLGNPLYSTSYNYTQIVINAINLARCHGYAVIVSMQDESRTGESVHLPLSTAATQRAWLPLLNAFGSAPDVLLEIYNEPDLSSTNMNWITWAHAGSPSYNQTYGNPNGLYGMQPMLNWMRNNGSSANVLIMDGLGQAATLSGIPGLTNPPIDPNNNALYAVHPYLRGGTTAPFASQWRDVTPLAYPVVGTEWSAPTADANLGLGNEGYDVAVQALNYFSNAHLLSVAGAFDIPGIMVQNVSDWTPSNYDHTPAQQNGTPSQSGSAALDNAGLLVQKWFANNYNVSLTDADGITH